MKFQIGKMIYMNMANKNHVLFVFSSFYFIHVSILFSSHRLTKFPLTFIQIHSIVQITEIKIFRRQISSQKTCSYFLFEFNSFIFSLSFCFDKDRCHRLLFDGVLLNCYIDSPLWYLTQLICNGINTSTKIKKSEP